MFAILCAKSNSYSFQSLMYISGSSRIIIMPATFILYYNFKERGIVEDVCKDFSSFKCGFGNYNYIISMSDWMDG